MFLIEMIFGIVFLALVFRARRLTHDLGDDRAAGGRQLVRWLLGGMRCWASRCSWGRSGTCAWLGSWTARFEDGVLIRSELAVATHAALAAAKIEIPFPQRDIHVRRAQSDRSDAVRRERGD